MNSTAIITCEQAVKAYGSLHAVDHVSFLVKRGESFCLLGRNGAGKSTLISLLTTLKVPQSGTVRIAGFDTATQGGEVRRRISVVFQDILLDEDLTATENMAVHAMLYKIPSPAKRIRALLEMVKLDKETRQVKTYSGGMKRRLEISRGLLSQPEIMFLDEPTLGLDPLMKHEVWSYVRKARRGGTTIVLATNDLLEAEALATRIALMDKGRIVYAASVQKTRKEYQTLENMFTKQVRRRR